MAKPRHIFLCRSCGAIQNRWLGKCPDCGAWDSLEEQILDKSAEKDPHKSMAVAWAEIADNSSSPSGMGGAPNLINASAQPLSAIAPGQSPLNRLATGIREFDRVLGGDDRHAGLVPGSAVLVGGEPGIGKSTLLLQAARAWAAAGNRVLYVSSEESAEQVKLRAERVVTSFEGDSEKSAKTTIAPDANTAPDSPSDNLFILADTNLARIIEQTRKVSPAVLVIDSIQMIYKADLDASPGSISQLRRCCSELVYLAKLSGIAVVLVGHVTKDGQLAGPRLLEHLVDTVLYFEGDRYHAHRLVRAIKNRYGTTLEIGLFEMTGQGLIPVTDAAGLAATQNSTPRPGAVVCPVMSGSRCYLVEVQALTATGFLGAAKRKSSGLDSNRLAMLIAVLEQHAGLRLADRDVFASAVGGIRVVEPAADLALLLAIAGAHYKRSLPAATAVIGEVGLGGEIRPVAQLEQRLREALRLGYTNILIPKVKPRATRGGPPVNSPHEKALGAEITRVATISEAMDRLA